MTAELPWPSVEAWEERTAAGCPDRRSTARHVQPFVPERRRPAASSTSTRVTRVLKAPISRRMYSLRVYENGFPEMENGRTGNGHASLPAGRLASLFLRLEEEFFVWNLPEKSSRQRRRWRRKAQGGGEGVRVRARASVVTSLQSAGLGRTETGSGGSGAEEGGFPTNTSFPSFSVSVAERARASPPPPIGPTSASPPL